MGTIRKLSAGMINKIAAGEVIERPASVVKELVENGLDAGATRIEIAIEKAGRERIAVVDNGRGIASDELELALSPHATSKIAETDDLFTIESFGFRGEALASIAEISQLTLQSRPEGALEGAMLRTNGPAPEPVTPCGMAKGTAIEVRNLFFNTPVRRKYLKSDSTEFGHISDAVIRLAIPNRSVHFILRHNGKISLDLPPTERIGERIGKIFGGNISARLISVNHQADGVRIYGYVGHPDLSRSNASMQYLFMNRRYIRDKALQHALAQGYRGLMTAGRYPVAFLMIELASDRVDVNVHPTKMEVRFLEPQRIYSGFLSAIREKFLQTDLRSRPALDSADNVCDDNPFGSANDSSPQSGLDSGQSERVRQSTLDWARHGVTNLSGSRPRPSGPSLGSHGAGSPPAFKPFSYSSDFDSSTPKRESVGAGFEPDDNLGDMGSLGKNSELDVPTSPRTFESVWSELRCESQNRDNGEFRQCGLAQGEMRPLVQIHRKYLVFQTETGMALVDQHALHERILYERIKRQMTAGELAVQRLLVPETVDLGPIEAACALENRALFADFGLLIEPFGGNTVLISGYPAIFSRLSATEIFLTLLPIVAQKQGASDRTDLLEAMMHQTACKAAVKGGDALGAEAMGELLRLADEELHTDHCPHGRPTTLLFTIAEIDKMFKRT